ncbi:LacI family transcriptional regulator [Cnuibacter physcomitrellae]|uniref:LacI family transcriptional regulator n=1 Tax=Cnuibacter physcomitrellae TaxID=1619308 RepID=A0A1X9LKD2_9MICO|nr:LacI family DNA-binding transcriptional regulator [Cnuibacter physcomitrellae]ARJ04932.1 LacI family transcriptional regulator [Cnuibacter physcomitrellae]GGI41548.1 LacI family transcriptional regulator [Cnuibacter physcomitrellae]
MATLSDVASMAGVSISAVSRVLSGAADARVSDATRQRIHDAARELRYQPNYAARALKLSRTEVVALVVPDLTNAIVSELMHGVEDEGYERGYMVLLARAERELEQYALPRLIGEGRIDGALVQAADAMLPDELREQIDSGLPVVYVNSNHPDDGGFVDLEDELGVAVATRHLIDLGHERLAFVGGLASSVTGRRRVAGFRSEMASSGLTVDDALVTDLGYELEAGRAAVRQLLAQRTRPTGIVVANINAGFGVLLELRSQGIEVPQDVSVVALHDAWTADSTWPPLTTVKMPRYELGRAAMAALYERIHGGTVPRIVVTDPPPRLIVRESTAALER